MRPSLTTFAALLLAACPAPAADPPDASKALERYYAHRLDQLFLRMANDPDPTHLPPPWEEPLKRLAAGSPADRAAAAADLLALLALALDDETSGKAPWRNTPYWGGGVDVPVVGAVFTKPDPAAKRAAGSATIGRSESKVGRPRRPGVEPVPRRIWRSPASAATRLKRTQRTQRTQKLGIHRCRGTQFGPKLAELVCGRLAQSPASGPIRRVGRSARAARECRLGVHLEVGSPSS